MSRCMRFVESFIAALRRHVATQGQGKRPPWQLWHAIIFYTAGELTRRAIPHHVPLWWPLEQRALECIPKGARRALAALSRRPDHV